MNSLGVLKSISQKQGIEGPVTESVALVSDMLEKGLEYTEQGLSSSSAGAPGPVDEIISYILDAGGKRIRPSLTLLSSRIVDSADPPIELAMVCEILHNATLLHDDVIDEGEIRRGKPAARMVWSNALSVLGGDYMLMKCVEMMSGLDPSFMPHFVETLKELVNGEIVQLGLRERLDATRDDYFRIVTGKTSSLFRFATYTGAKWARATSLNCEAAGEFGKNIGVAFQLIDDVLDFSVNSDELGKDLLADIGQGKMTLPVILAREEEPEVAELLLELVEGDGNPVECAVKISGIVKKSGSLEVVRKEATEYTQRCVDALDRIDNGNPEALAMLKELAYALLHRKR